MPIAPIEQEEPVVLELNVIADEEVSQPRIVIPTPTFPAPPTQADSLILDYQIEWRVDPTDPGYVLASVRLHATGGDGLYTFYRDETVTNSAYFSYRWSSCKDNSGAFRVESADGQSTTVEYFEQPPCPDRGQSEVNN